MEIKRTITNMKNAIVIHGTCDRDEYFNNEHPSLSNSHWIPWIQKQLLIKGFSVQTPEMPDAYSPDYIKWKECFEKFDLNTETILIGHSCGGGFLLRWLSENPIEINKLVLVAPWLDPYREKTESFFDFHIDPSLASRTNEIHIFVSQDDDKDILDSVKTIDSKIPENLLHNFKNRGHFCLDDMKTEEFPELLECVLQ